MLVDGGRRRTSCLISNILSQGDLASVEDQSENDYLQISLQALTGGLVQGPYAWVGGHRRSDSPWHWTDGLTWNYTNWNNGNPHPGNNIHNLLN